MIWGILGVCLVLSFLLSGIESALLAVSPVRVRHSACETPRRRGAAWLARAFARRERLLASVLLLNDIATLLAFAIVTRELVVRTGPTGYLIAFAISLPVYLFAFELVPKSLFERFPYRLLRLCHPLLWTVNGTLGQVLRGASLFARSGGAETIDPADDADDGAASPNTTGRQEFRNLTDIIARQGLIGASATRLIRSILDFPRIKIAQVMIPLARVTAVPLDLPVRRVLELSQQGHYDQLPVLARDGSLVGLIHVFEILRQQAPQGLVINFMQRIVRARPGDAARDVLIQLRANGVQLAAVNDDDGTPLGIVSAEDIVARMLDGGGD